MQILCVWTVVVTERRLKPLVLPGTTKDDLVDDTLTVCALMAFMLGLPVFVGAGFKHTAIVSVVTALVYLLMTSLISWAPYVLLDSLGLLVIGALSSAIARRFEGPRRHIFAESRMESERAARSKQRLQEWETVQQQAFMNYEVGLHAVVKDLQSASVAFQTAEKELVMDAPSANLLRQDIALLEQQIKRLMTDRDLFDSTLANNVARSASVVAPDIQNFIAGEFQQPVDEDNVARRVIRNADRHRSGASGAMMADARREQRNRSNGADVDLSDDVTLGTRSPLDVGTWSLDLIHMVTESSHPVLAVGYWALEGPRDTIGIEARMLIALLTKVDSLYCDNPFHNATHAADVANSTVFLMRACAVSYEEAPLEEFALVLAALCHDIAHPGYNNSFLVATRQDLAIVYNDVSVLESMHASTAIRLLETEQESAVLKECSEDDRILVRKIVIQCILDTDMTSHMNFVGKLNLMIDGLDLKKASDRLEVSRMFIKCADLGHSAKPWHIHRAWSLVLFDEFYKQGGREQKLGLPISPLCDRTKVRDTGVSQVEFLEVICRPLWALAARIETEEKKVTENCCQNIAANMVAWNQYKIDEDTEVLQKWPWISELPPAKRWTEDAT